MLLLKQLITILPFVCLTSGQLAFDQDFQLACSRGGEDYVPRDPPNGEATTGDQCKFKVNGYTSDQKDANLLCTLYTPWRLIKASPGNPTICHVEATLMCRPGWKQMFGYCFYMDPDRKHFTYREAVNHCASKGSYLPNLHHRSIASVWKRSFPRLSQTWIITTEAQESYTKVLDEEGEVILAINGFLHSGLLPHKSLVRVDRNEKFQVLCQHKPDMTAAEVRYITKRYSEIYYPAIPYENLMLVRSSSQFTRSHNNARVCEKVVKPYMMIGNQPFIPRHSVLPSLSNMKGKKQFGSIFHAEAYADIHPTIQDVMDVEGCSSVPKQFMIRPKHRLWQDSFININETSKCDNMRTLAITNHGRAKFRVMSDSHTAPVLCKVGTKTEYLIPIIPKGEKLHIRKTGELVTHWVVPSRPKDVFVFQDRCKYGSVMAGWESMEELYELIDLLVEKGLTNQCAIVGNERKVECLHLSGYDPNPKSQCSRQNALKWLHGAANVPIADEMFLYENGVMQPNKGKSYRASTVVCHRPHYETDRASNGYVKEIEPDVDAKTKDQDWSSFVSYPVICQRNYSYIVNS